MKYLLCSLLLVAQTGFTQILPDSSVFFASDSQLPPSVAASYIKPNSTAARPRTLLLVKKTTPDSLFTQEKWHTDFRVKNLIRPAAYWLRRGFYRRPQR